VGVCLCIYFTCINMDGFGFFSKPKHLCISCEKNSHIHTCFFLPYSLFSFSRPSHVKCVTVGASQPLFTPSDVSRDPTELITLEDGYQLFVGSLNGTALWQVDSTDKLYAIDGSWYLRGLAMVLTLTSTYNTCIAYMFYVQRLFVTNI
jgi:hypothetical protein